MESRLSPIEDSLKSKTDLHLEWLKVNSLDERLYSICINEGVSVNDILLERSVKLDTSSLKVISQKRYVVCDEKPTPEKTHNIIFRCSENYTSNAKTFITAFDAIYKPHQKHHLYVGLDNDIFKAGMDYINECLIGIASVNGQCYYRKYNLHKDDSWYQQLFEYLNIYSNRLNPLITKAYSTAMNNCKNSSSRTMYIKQDDEGLVFHMDTKQFKIPQFEVLLRNSTSFKEKFTWISINDQLSKLTVYMRPVFKTS